MPCIPSSPCSWRIDSSDSASSKKRRRQSKRCSARRYPVANIVPLTPCAQAGRKKSALFQEQDKQFEQKLIEKLKAEDVFFADDFDVEKKKRETQQQIAKHVQDQLKKSLLVDGSPTLEVSKDRDVSLFLPPGYALFSALGHCG